MPRVLVIDDEKDVGEVVREAIVRDIAGAECIVEMDFHKGMALIPKLQPDAIVLDLMEGNQSTNLPGQATWASVWTCGFCPVVIYTGFEGDLVPPVPANHPFVKVIKKGGGTHRQVTAELKAFAPAIEAVRSLRDEVNAVIHRVLRDTAGAGAIPTGDRDHLLHAGRRRIAASMDSPTIIGQRELKSWEQYLIPAIGDSPLTADLLRERGAEWDAPEAYRLVLTPSCDMVKGRCEPTLIVARCAGPLKLAERLSLSLKQTKIESDADNIVKKVLTSGAFIGFLPLPPFPSLLPVLVANLKDLEVLPWEAIGRADGGKPSFDRVASIDSPFREQVSWAYLTTVARPGMPDRDLKSWAQDIVKAATPVAQKT